VRFVDLLTGNIRFSFDNVFCLSLLLIINSKKLPIFLLSIVVLSKLEPEVKSSIVESTQHMAKVCVYLSHQCYIDGFGEFGELCIMWIKSVNIHKC